MQGVVPLEALNFLLLSFLAFKFSAGGNGFSRMSLRSYLSTNWKGLQEGKSGIHAASDLRRTLQLFDGFQTMMKSCALQGSP